MKSIVAVALFVALSTQAISQNFTMSLAGKPAGGKILDVELSPAAGTPLFAAVDSDVLYKSIDNGANWTRLGASPFGSKDIDIDANGIIYAITSVGVYISKDNTGNTWQLKSLPFFADACVAIKKYGTVNTSPLYVLMRPYASTSIIYKSIDGGTTWVEAYSEPIASGNIKSFTVTTTGVVLAYVVGKGIVKSPDGVTFSLATTGMTTIDPYDDPNFLSPFVITATGDVFVAMTSKIYKTSDSGASWSDVTPAGPNDFSGSRLSSSGNIVYLVSRSAGKLFTYSAGTWTSANVSVDGFTTFSFMAKSASEFYMGTDIGFLKSSNGTTWSTSSSGITAVTYAQSGWSYINNLLLSGDVLYTSGLPMLKSTDGGITWTNQPFVPSASRSIVMLANGTFMSPSGNQVYVSANSGTTWTVKSVPFALKYLVADGNTAYGFDESASVLYKTQDAGTTWVNLNATNLPGVTLAELQNIQAANGRIYFFGYGFPYYKLYTYSIADNAVSEITLPDQPAGTRASWTAWAVGSKLYFAAPGAIYISGDLGGTWAKVTVPMVMTYFQVLPNGYWLAIRQGESLWLSKDEGLSWSTASFVNGGVVRGALVDNSGLINVLLDSDGLYKSNSPIIPPPAPTSLSIIGSTFREVRLEWKDNSTQESYFRIERAIGASSTYDSVGAVTSSSQATKYANIVLTTNPQTTYSYRVVAVNAAGTSAFSNSVQITTPAKCPLTVPNQKVWNIATVCAALGNRAGSVALTLGRFDDYSFFSAPLLGNSPVWAAPYVSLGTVTTSLIENCGSVYMQMAANSFITPDGNGTWDPITQTIVIKWKLNESVTPPGTAAPVSGETTLTVGTTTGSIQNVNTPTVSVYNNKGIGVGWVAYPSPATEVAVERATSTGGPFTELGRVVYPDHYFVDETPEASNGTTYYYRLRAYNEVNTTVGVGGSPSAGIAFAKPYFAGVETQNAGTTPTRVGGAWGDVDNDGYEDLFCAVPSSVGADPPTIFLNKGNETFVSKVFLPQPGLPMPTSKFADFDNDGNLDVIAFNADQSAGFIEIYAGDGTGNFTKRFSTGRNVSTAFALDDVDGDGKLDIILGNIAGVGTSATINPIVMKNNGNFSFSKLLDLPLISPSTVFGIAPIDYDNDGDRDILIYGRFENGTKSLRMFVKNINGTFTGTDVASLNTKPNSGVSAVEWVDIDNDLDYDLMVQYVVGNSRELFQNQGNGVFTNLTSSVAVETNPSVTFSWADVDNDGDMDMIQPWSSVSQFGAIYINDGSGNFTRKSGEAIVTWNYGRFLYTAADFNKDGSVDFFVGSNDSRARVFKGNNFQSANNWLEVDLRGVTNNARAIGALVKVTTGPLVQRKFITTSMASTGGGHHSLIQHFGLGAATTASVEVTWPDGKKQTATNIAANQILKFVEDYTPPQVSGRTPANNATNVSAVSSISLTLNEGFQIATGKFVEVYDVVNSGIPIYKIDASSGTVNGNTITYTVNGRLPQGVQIGVSIPAGTFVDIYGNASAAITISDWKFSTANGPALSTVVPGIGATNIDVKTSLEINFDKPVVAVANKKIFIMDGLVEVQRLEVTAGTINNSKFTITPVNALPYSKTLKIIVENGAFQDDAVSQNDFTGLSAGQWSFTTVAAPDVVKPVVAFDPSPFATLDKGLSPATANIIATDDIGVTSVTMYTRKVSELNFTSWPATKLTGNNWSVSITSAMQDDMGFEYYIEAKDAASNSGRAPETGKFYTSQTKLSGAFQPLISFPGQGTKASWRIISVPYSLSADDRKIGKLFATLGEYKKTSWRILLYSNDPKQRYVEYPELASVERGVGYFINSRNAQTITLSNPSAPAYSRSNLFSMNLVKGWNQIGNPYSVTINWDDIRTYNGNSDIGKLVVFDNGSFKSGTTLEAGQGGFVLMNNPGTVLFSFPGQVVGSGRTYQEEQPGTLDSENWRVDITLSAGDVTSDLAGFGMNPNANISYDQFDGFNPPRFFDFIEMQIPHTEHFMKTFSRDIVAPAPSKEWDFIVETNQTGVVELTWDNSTFGNSNVELWLYDITRQMPIDMRTNTSYSFEPSSGRQFKVYYGKGAYEKIVASRILLGDAYPNPASGRVTIPFSLPEKNGTFAVRLEIFDIVGRRVNTVFEGDLAPGFYRKDWLDAENSHPEGIYVYRLTVGQNGQSETLSGKIVLKK